MKPANIPLFLFAALLLAACSDSRPSTDAAADSIQPVAGTAAAAPVAVEPDPDSILGYYTGPFNAVEYDENRRPSYTNKITVSLDSVRGKMLYGHSVAAGNSRPFSGPVEKSGGRYTATVREPGDDKYDGSFTFVVDPATRQLTGAWVANNKSLAVTKRDYTLEKRAFRYDPNLALPENLVGGELYDETGQLSEEGAFESVTADVLRINPSKTMLRKEDVENLYKGDLEVLRNSIYARHGYSFKNRKMRYIFDSAVDWYMPVSTDVRMSLTEVERRNNELLKRYEQHAAQYYDSFGR